MLTPTPFLLALVGLAAAVGAMMNAMAGGGTLITFPALVALGVPPITANATSTVALWPGTMASMSVSYTHLTLPTILLV